MRSTGLRALLISISATVAIVACAGGQTAPTPTAVASQAPPTAAPTPPVTPTAAPQATATPAPEATPSPTPVPATPDVPFTLMSDVFVDGGPIPVEYTCDGPDVQLPLSWTGTPAGTVELALVMDDPDAGGFVHWVAHAIPADATALPDPLPPEVQEGQNDFGGTGYAGPCPPPGVHHYVLTLYALSVPLDVATPASAADVRAAATDATIATAVLTGTYSSSN